VACRIPRVTTKRPAEPENLDADKRAFQQLHEVLSGKRRLGLDGASSKMLRIVLGGRDTDTVITPETFVVQFGPKKQRLPSRYFRRLSPRMMSELLGRASINAVEGPLVVGLPAGNVPKAIGAFPEWSYDAKLVWIVPGADAVRVMVRKSSERWRQPFAQPIPTEGAFVLRELPEWAPAEIVFRDFAAPFPCPRCGTSASRYREIRGAFVCLHCGRSFEHFR
jgi:hypothetical protein